MTIRKLVLVLLIGAAGFSANAQIQRNYFKTLELFAGAGSTLYFGDIGGRDSNTPPGILTMFDNLDIDLWKTRPAFTFGARYSLFKKFAASLHISPTFLAGSDQRSSKFARNYEFNTFVTEVNLQAEYFFGNRLIKVTPYALLAAGEVLYLFKPATETAFSKAYNTNTFNFGGGVHFPSRNGISHAIEFAYHFTNTDGLDGYWDEGTNDDLFFTATYKIYFERNAGRGR